MGTVEHLLQSIRKHPLHDHIKDITVKLQNIGYDGIQTDTFGKTPLHYAVQRGYEDIVLGIINHYKDIDVSDNIFHKPLRLGSQVGNSVFSHEVSSTSHLIRLINNPDKENRSALLYAMERKYYVIACILVLHGASLDVIPVDYQKDLLLYAAEKTHTAYDNEHEYRPIVGLLAIKVPEAVLDFSEDYEYPRLLRYYIKQGHMQVVKALVDAVQDTEKQKRILNYGDNMVFPLDAINFDHNKLSDEEHLEGAKYLLEKGAKKTWNNTNRIRVILKSAARQGHLKTFKYFMFREDKKDFNTYLGLAAIHDHMNIVKFLWKSYRPYTTVESTKDTALHNAAWSGGLASVKYLCENGATLNCKNIRGETPLDYAIKANRQEIISYLLSRYRSSRY